MSLHEWILIGVLGFVLFGILWALERRNKSSVSKINLDDLLLGDDGKISKGAFVLLGSFILTSWVIIFQTINSTLSDTVFGLYVGSWIVPTVTKLIKGTPPGASSETMMTTRTTTHEEAEK
jgi:hypothetical protein